MFKKIFQKLFYNPYKFIQENNACIDFGNSYVSKSFYVRFVESKKKCLEIGNGNILECECIYETNKGHISIGDNVYIGVGTKLISVNNIQIGNNVQISWGCTLYDHNGYSINHLERRNEFSKIYKNYKSVNKLSEFDWSKVKSAPIVIEDDVWIGFGATILKGVKIGKGAIVGAQSVVTKDVEPFTVVMGNPAVKIKDLNK